MRDGALDALLNFPMQVYTRNTILSVVLCQWNGNNSQRCGAHAATWFFVDCWCLLIPSFDTPVLSTARGTYMLHHRMAETPIKHAKIVCQHYLSLVKQWRSPYRFPRPTAICNSRLGKRASK